MCALIRLTPNLAIVVSFMYLGTLKEQFVFTRVGCMTHKINFTFKGFLIVLRILDTVRTLG